MGQTRVIIAYPRLFRALCYALTRMLLMINVPLSFPDAYWERLRPGKLIRVYLFIIFGGIHSNPLFYHIFDRQEINLLINIYTAYSLFIWEI